MTTNTTVRVSKGKLAKRNTRLEKKRKISRLKTEPKVNTKGQDYSPLIVPTHQRLSSIWDNAHADDIGTGFKAASSTSRRVLLARAVQAQAQKEMDELAAMPAEQRAAYAAEKRMKKAKGKRGSGNKFLTGTNRFIFYIIKADASALKKKAEKNKRKPKSVNYANPITDLPKRRFITQLKTQIDKTSNFLWNEILPMTNSLMTAIERVDDFSQQVLDEASGVPVKVLQRKMEDAVSLRIIRHVADQFKLTKEERVLFTAEYRTKLPSGMF
jgi:hypothetical protein